MAGYPPPHGFPSGYGGYSGYNSYGGFNAAGGHSGPSIPTYHRTEDPYIEENEPNPDYDGLANHPHGANEDIYGQPVNWEDRGVPHRMRERTTHPVASHSPQSRYIPGGSTVDLHRQAAYDANPARFHRGANIARPPGETAFLRQPGVAEASYMRTGNHPVLPTRTHLPTPQSLPQHHQGMHSSVPYSSRGHETLAGCGGRRREQGSEDGRVNGQIHVPTLQRRYQDRMAREIEDGVFVSNRSAWDHASTSATSASRQHNDAQYDPERRCKWCREVFDSSSDRKSHQPFCKIRFSPDPEQIEEEEEDEEEEDDNAW